MMVALQIVASILILFALVALCVWIFVLANGCYKCPRCQGTRKIADSWRTLECPKCQGAGYLCRR